MFRKYFLPRIVFLFYKLLSWTWQKQVLIDPEVQKYLDKKSPLILAHWHGDELAVLHLVSFFKLVTMTSTSQDGQLIDYVIRKMGGDTSKGSSTRGGIGALKGLVRLVKSGRVASMAVDGPKGPIYQVKPGVFELSKLTSAPIVPVGVGVISPFVFNKSWNKAILPKPFQKIVITFGPLLPPVAKDASTKDEGLAKDLGQHLQNAKENAIKLIAAITHQ